jgi:uncharacterized protein (TIGR03083 family)
MDWSWAGPPLDTRPQFPAERAEFVSLLRSLDASDWRRPTVCPGWRVHDVVAHVGHDYLRKLSRSRDRHPAPGPGRDEGLPAFLSRLNQEFVDVAACWSPAVLTDLLEHLGPQLDQLWAALDLGELGEPVSWAAPGEPAPHWLDVAREYSEYWVHQQQVRDAVGRPGANSDALTGPVIDAFLRAVPYALRHTVRAPGTCAEIRIAGPGGGIWTVGRLDVGPDGSDQPAWAIGRGPVVGAGPVAAAGPASRPAAAVIRLSSDCLWRVATRGITVTSARGQAELSGDQELAAAALTLVSIIR